MNKALDVETRRAKLESYFRQGQDYRVFVGVPLENPMGWDEVFSMEGDALWGADLRAYPIAEASSWVVCYANLELVDGEGLFEPLPEGVTQIRATSAEMPRFKAGDLKAGLRLVSIEFEQSPTHPRERWYYLTRLTNLSGERIRCLAFGAYVKGAVGFVLSNVTGSLFSAEQFEEWYGVRRGGWIEPGESVADPTNYGSQCYWVYYFETESGGRFHTGRELRLPGFWRQFLGRG